MVNVTRETLQGFKQFLVMKIYEALLKTSLRGQRDLSGLASSTLSQEIHFAETQPKAARGELACKDSSCTLAWEERCQVPYGSEQYNVLPRVQGSGI